MQMQPSDRIMSARAYGGLQDKGNVAPIGYTPLPSQIAHMEYTTKRAGAKMLGCLKHFNREGVGVEKSSVYGAAVLMPQIGRTLGWPRDFIGLSVSAWIYLFFCYFLHGSLLMFIAKEENVLNMFGGQMFLCDFGAGLDDCDPDDPNDCIGPGGTRMTAPRLYDWEQWAVRNFVRDSLRALNPDKDNIDQLVDPGEYGVESYWCRLMCVHIFVLSIIGEFYLIVRMAKMLWYVPTRGEPWVEDGNQDAAEAAGPAQGAADVDKWWEEIKIRVSGIPCHWKLMYFFGVCFPKFLLWWVTAMYGCSFLMETSSIDGIIVNSVALGFLLSFDELITVSLMSVQANQLIDKCEDFHTSSSGDAPTEDEALRHLEENMGSKWRCVIDLLWNKLFKLFLCLFLTLLLVGLYYHEHCEQTKNGRWVSKSLYPPKRLHFTVLNGFLGHFFPIEHEETPSWTYAR